MLCEDSSFLFRGKLILSLNIIINIIAIRHIDGIKLLGTNDSTIFSEEAVIILS